MKIIFMATPQFAIPSGDALLASGHDVVAVVTVPDKPAGRGLAVRQSAIKSWAAEHHLKLFQPEKLRDQEFINDITRLNPDVIVVVAFRILPREVYTLAAKGAFNLHASLLPKYRGAAPINWAIINGERETGVTTFFLQDSVDTGSIILQESLTIGENESAGELHDRLYTLGADVVRRTIECIASGEVSANVQDAALASPAPKLTTETGRINWSQGAEQIHNRVRGLSPTPGAWTTLNGKTLKILRTLLTDLIPEPAAPGECVVEHGTLFVKTEDVMIEVLELQMAGRARTTGAQFVQGRGVSAREMLG